MTLEAPEERQSSLRELQSKVNNFKERLERTRSRLEELIVSLEPDSTSKAEVKKTDDWECAKPENKIQEIQTDIEYFDHLVEEINKSMLYLEGVLK